jgi:hypothetical protein
MEKWTVHRISTVKNSPALNFIASWFQQNMQKTISSCFYMFFGTGMEHITFFQCCFQGHLAIAGMLPTTNWKTYLKISISMKYHKQIGWHNPHGC